MVISAALTGKTAVTQSMCCTSHMCSLGLLNAANRLPVPNHSTITKRCPHLLSTALESWNSFCALALKHPQLLNTERAQHIALICFWIQFDVHVSSLCYGGVRIYFGGVTFCACSQGRLCTSPPPTRRMWPTFIAGIETHCYFNQLAHTARRGAA